jgi:Domain of unknown function (DUF397)
MHIDPSLGQVLTGAGEFLAGAAALWGSKRAVGARRKRRRRSSGGCVEVAAVKARVVMRDSKDSGVIHRVVVLELKDSAPFAHVVVLESKDSAVLVFIPKEWEAFLDGQRQEEFDLSA